MAAISVSVDLREALKSRLSDEEWQKVSEILDQHSSRISTKPLAKQIKETADRFAKKKKKRVQRPFDFMRYNTRHVALKIAYLGWDYHGFVVQEDSEDTVERHLFEALTKTKLIESRKAANYSRCGRTDVGVSAFGQVIAIDLRTNLLEGRGVIPRSSGMAHTRTGTTAEEVNYPQILNRVLPNEIRVLAWTPVEPGFSARFDTLHRTYKYFFPVGDLDTRLMSEAAERLVGTHDFRNFCKMDVANGVVNYVRTIKSAVIQKLDDCPDGYQMCEFTITGLAFLYHQVRCITALLFLIGQRKEEPDIIDQLLDVDTNPCKPQYPMAADYPLVLYDCAYEGLEWIYDKAGHEKNINLFQEMWTGHRVRAAMMKSMLSGLATAPVRARSSQSRDDDRDGADGDGSHRSTDAPSGGTIPWCETRPPARRQAATLFMGLPSKNHKRLLDRPKAESLENRIEHFAKRRKFNNSNSDSSA